MGKRATARRVIASLVLFGSSAAIASIWAVTPAGAKEAAKPPTVLPSIQLTTDISPTRIYNQPQVLVDPTDNKRLVVVEADASTGECWVEVSENSGRTWVTRDTHPRPKQYQSCFRPSYGPYLDAKFGIDGTLYVSSAASDLGPPFLPYIARSSDLGETWQFTMLATAVTKDWKKYDGTTVNALENYQATRMAVSPIDPNVVVAGFAYYGRGVSYNDSPPRGSIFISTDHGRTFGPRIDPWADGFPPDKGGIDYPTTVIDKKGTIFVFSKERPPGSTAQPPPGHRMWLAKSTDMGKTWQTSIIDPSPCAFCITPPNATVDLNTGALYVVYERTEVLEGTDRNIWFIKSTDGGKTWTDRVKLNDDQTGKRQFGANQYHPGIAVAPDGRITVAWHDFRNDILYNTETKGVRFSSPDETYWDVYSTYSTDGGKTWAPNVRVSDRSMNRKAGFTTNDQVLFGPMGIATTNDATYIAWADSRAGTPQNPVEDAYFTQLVFREPGAGSKTSSFVWALVGAAAALAVGGLILILGLSRARRGDDETLSTAPSLTKPERADQHA